MSLPPEVLDHPYWYLGRATGLISYVLLALSTSLGLGISSRIFDGLLNRGWVYEMHRFGSLLVMALLITHALVMVPDPFARLSAGDVLLPFYSEFKTGPMALGILGLYAGILVTGSSYLTRRIGQRTWRILHYLTFVMFLLATGHGIWTGTDSSLAAVTAMYFAAGLAVLFLLFYRIVALKNPKQASSRNREGPGPAGARSAAAGAPQAPVPRADSARRPVS